MKRFMERLLLVIFLLLSLGASSCYGGTYVGYGYGGGYGYGYGGGGYNDVFYSAPIDRYGYGFYGHP